MHKYSTHKNTIIFIVIFYDFSLNFAFFFTVSFTELLSSWESLLNWSENESVAKKLQEEMDVLIGKLKEIGTSTATLDTESAIHLAIEDTKVSFIERLLLNKGANRVLWIKLSCQVDPRRIGCPRCVWSKELGWLRRPKKFFLIREYFD